MKIIVPNTIKNFEDMIIEYSTPNDWAFPLWDSLDTYYQGNMTVFNGKLYRCLEFNKGKQPDTYKDAFWFEWGAWNNTTEPLWNIDTTYEIGDLVTYRAGYKKYIYKATASSVGVTPISDANKWYNIGAINIYRSVYGATENKTEYAGDFSITYEANKADYVYMVGVDALSAQIEILDSADNQLLNKSESLSSKDASSWKEYFFKDFVTKSTFGTEIPIGYNYKAKVSLSSNNTARIGNVIIGKSFYVGEALWGASAGILDFSTASRDNDFGDVTLIQGSYANRADVRVICDTKRADLVKKFLTDIRSKEVLILGDDRDDGFDMLKIRGFIRDFDVSLSNNVTTEININIEGLI